MLQLARSFSAGCSSLLFRQLFETESCTYSYILADYNTKDALIIDPVLETVDRDDKLIKELGLTLKYAVNTHMHADHITGTGLLKKRFSGCKSVIGKASGAKADHYIAHGDFIEFGGLRLECRSTPGHTNGCMTYVFHEGGMAFTGDSLMIRGCGRTDFQEGSPSLLYSSIYKQIFSLPDNFLIYPAHDYLGRMATTVGEEKKFNPRLTKPEDQFINIMNNLGLSKPKKFDIAVPANLVCGIFDHDTIPK